MYYLELFGTELSNKHLNFNKNFYVLYILKKKVIPTYINIIVLCKKIK